VSEAISCTDRDKADCAILDLDLGDGSTAVMNTSMLIEAGFKVLIVSALADPVNVRSALKAGALGFVSKSAPPEELITALQATIAGELSTSTDVAALLYSDESISVNLSEREQTAMMLYASGLKIEAVARRMGVKPSTAQEYIKRVREKYLKKGTALPTRTDIYKQARDEGLVP
jgi:DNA-binding NarL/FixJ family response regulator